MALLNTLILPTDDAALARQQLSELIYKHPQMVMISLGTSNDVTEMVGLADALVASQALILAQAWARKPEDVAAVIDQLQAVPPSLKQLFPEARAITLSRGDVVKDVITGSEPKPDMTRVWGSFAKAAQP